MVETEGVPLYLCTTPNYPYRVIRQGRRALKSLRIALLLLL
jgi:hypothetical protein